MGIYEPFDIKIMFPDNRLISDPITLETLSQFIGLGNDRALWLVLTREATDPRLWHAHPTFRWPAQSWLDLTEPPLYSKRLNEYEANSLRVLKRDCVRKTDFSLSEGADLLRSVFFYLSLSERAKISRTKEEEKKVGTKRKTPPSSMAFAAPKKTRDTLETKWLAKAFNVEKRLHQLSKPYLKDRCKDFWRPLLQRFEYSTQAVLRGFASPTEELKGVQGASTQQMPPTSAPQRHSQVFSVADSAQAMAPTYPAAESYLPTEGLKPEAVAPTWFPDEPYLPRGQPAHAAPMDTWFPEEPSLPLGQPANAAPMEMFRMVNGTVPSGIVEMHNSFPQEGEQPWEDPFLFAEGASDPANDDLHLLDDLDSIMDAGAAGIAELFSEYDTEDRAFSDTLSPGAPSGDGHANFRMIDANAVANLESDHPALTCDDQQSGHLHAHGTWDVSPSEAWLKPKQGASREEQPSSKRRRTLAATWAHSGMVVVDPGLQAAAEAQLAEPGDDHLTDSSSLVGAHKEADSRESMEPGTDTSEPLSPESCDNRRRLVQSHSEEAAFVDALRSASDGELEYDSLPNVIRPHLDRDSLRRFRRSYRHFREGGATGAQGEIGDYH
mmetsp:Transcript_9972/g.37639  ORF Transcript_9972/g.37639 Transcript_9972/m.37639 type:complete len:608 (+) Transcript_9972:5567-7390(+)